MDAEKDKHPPEKSLSFNAMPTEEEEEDKHLPHKSYSFAYRDGEQEQHLDHHPQNQDDNAPPSPAENEPKQDNIVEESGPPSSSDVVKVLEEIDQFISALSTAKAQQSDPPEVTSSFQQFVLLVDERITNYDTESSVRWSLLAVEDPSKLFESVDRISNLTLSLCEFSSESKYASSINCICSIHQRAMSYLEDEFRSLLEDYKSPDNQETPESDTTGDSNFPGYSDDVMSNLKRITKSMILGGYDTECCEVYIDVRRKLLEDSLRKLEFEKISMDDVQKMNWESLERAMVSWIKTFKECTTVYLPGERRFTDSLFSDHNASISDSLFANLSRITMIQLLNFVEAVAMTKRSAEKLFKFLDTYEILRDLIPAMDGLFPEELKDEIRSEALLTRCRLGEAMVCIFCELENSIKSDTAKTPVPGGAVHPLTRYTMNYLKYACEYKETLDLVFKEHQMIERADSMNSGSDFDYTAAQDQMNNNNNQTEVVQQSPFATQVMKVMDLLNANLEAKSKLYKDISLSSIFMMNNGRYISQKIRSAPEIKGLIDETWCRKQSADVRQYHKNYQRETWVRLLQCLTQEGLNVNGKVSKQVLKDRFKNFNTMFEEIHKTQCTWMVSDEQLQSELRVSIAAVVIPAYRSFMARYSQTLTSGRQSDKYIKYQPEDLETYIEELFDGSPAPPMGRRRP
ncbi:exocyst complex component EXO70C1-like [Cornus florida]|uniref:exocyst complex component EXO70C1-like n=1 Tax=Cornus florida TaxID=4283 RepID=UPI00289FE3C3|nr:exocyst complex component EXO70C1-like [Cornus florida]